MKRKSISITIAMLMVFSFDLLSASSAFADPEAERPYRQCARGCLPMAIKQLRHLPADQAPAAVTDVCIKGCRSKADAAGLSADQQADLMAETLETTRKPPYWASD